MIRQYKYEEVSGNDLFLRTQMPTNVEDIVSDIIADIKENGDAALRLYSRKFDDLGDAAFEVCREEIDAAYDRLDPALRETLEKSAANIRNFHKHQVRSSFIVNDRPGVVLGQKILPIEKVGIYVPGGTAAYPSTVLMNGIPASIAGCSQIIMVTPAKSGVIKDSLLAAAKIAGIDRVFRVGGAQAVAALAFGTESIPKVDKIVGPGNAFVAEAKKQVFGRVAIDMIAGPSEILIVADSTCDPKLIAIDMLSQAEHDKFATAVLVTDSQELADAVGPALEELLGTLPREEIARASIENNGKIIVTPDIMTAIDMANEIAPEHFELCVDRPFDYLDHIRHAGSVFLGKNSPEALGDYFAGPNHTLPTSGTARFSSPLSVDDFVKKMQYSYYSDEAIKRDADDIARIGREEMLEAHALSAESRR